MTCPGLLCSWARKPGRVHTLLTPLTMLILGTPCPLPKGPRISQEVRGRA